MGLVLARHRRPLNRVRHAGGLSCCFPRTKNKTCGVLLLLLLLFFRELKLVSIRQPLSLLLLLLLLLLLFPPSSPRRFLLYSRSVCLLRTVPTAPTAAVTSSGQPSDRRPVPETWPPMAVWLLRDNADRERTVWASRHCCWLLRVCLYEQARVCCCVQVRLVKSDFALNCRTRLVYYLVP